MKIKSVTTHTVTFSVQYFEATEGGMDNGTFGNECSDIGAAITLLQLAKAQNDQRDWTIVCDVHTDVGSSEI